MRKLDENVSPYVCITSNSMQNSLHIIVATFIVRYISGNIVVLTTDIIERAIG